MAADALAGNRVQWQTRTGRKGEGAIPIPYDGMVTRPDGTSLSFPAARDRYTQVVFLDGGGDILQSLAPARSASAERGMLAQMLAEAKAERAAAAAAETQRLAMLQAANVAATQAQNDRDAAALRSMVRRRPSAMEPRIVRGLVATRSFPCVVLLHHNWS